MSASIASKNLFDLLGDDAAEPDQAAPAPKQDKSKAGKQTPAQPPAPKSVPARSGHGGRGRGAVSGNEAAFRDRGAGADRNRERGADEHHEGRGGRGRGRGRGGRGGRGGARDRPYDDRHSKTGVSDHEKQVDHGWGGDKTAWDDEKAGEVLAKADEKEENAEGEGDANGKAAEEPEQPKVKTYEDYLAEQAEKKLQLSSGFEERKPNEGATKKFPEGKALERNEDDDAFIVGSGGKKARERAKKEKNVVELDGERMRQTDQAERRGGRGGRGGPRGGGDFGGRGGRGRGDGTRGSRGAPRGARGDRGDRGDRGHAPNVADKSAFPSLGA